MGQTLTTNGVKYNVDKLIELAKQLPIEDIPLETLSHCLDSKCWSDEINDPEMKLPNFSPRDVLQNHGEEPKYDYHYQKALKADLSYPILLEKNMHVADGMHRILRAYLQKESTIKAVVFEELPEEAKVKLT